MIKKVPTALVDVDTREVSLVDRGANKKKRFPFSKTENIIMKNWEEILEATLKTEVDTEKEFLKALEKIEKISDKGVNAVKAALRLLSAFKEEIPSEAIAMLNKLIGITKPDDPEKTKKRTDGDIVIKMEDLPEEIQKRFNQQDEALRKSQEKNEQFEKQMQDLKDREAKNEWRGKIEKDLQFFPGASIDEMTEDLFEISKTNPDLAKKQFERMQKASKALENSDLLKQIGLSTGKSDDLNAEQQLQRKADEYIQKDLKMTKEQAFTKAMDENPDLYLQYERENPKQFGK